MVLLIVLALGLVGSVALIRVLPSVSFVTGLALEALLIAGLIAFGILLSYMGL